MTMLLAAVIGLGQVGSRFDEEQREAVWSHAGAYLALPAKFGLVAGADIDSGNRERFSNRAPAAALFEDGVMLMSETKPDVVSICTPPQGRADLIETLIEAHQPRALICEKPMEVTNSARNRIIAICADARVGLLVNYNRRYAST